MISEHWKSCLYVWSYCSTSEPGKKSLEETCSTGNDVGDLREAASDIFVQTVNLSSSVGFESSEVNENELYKGESDPKGWSYDKNLGSK